MKLGFIGTGNMGGALARAAARSGQGNELLLANRTRAKAEALAAELRELAREGSVRSGVDNAFRNGGAGIDLENGGIDGKIESGETDKDEKLIRVCEAEAVAAESDYLFLGVKPQMMEALLEELRPILAARKDRFALVTMAAGLTMESIGQMAGNAAYPVIRIMPNTPAGIGEGMVLYDCNEAVTKEQSEQFLSVMQGAGRFSRLGESLIDAGSAISGCGPAFACLFAEALADGGVACGLPRAQALEYACQMLAGTAKLILESGETPGKLKDAVCSPGGTTIQGVRTLEDGGFRGTVMEAVIAAYEKTLELKR